MKTKKTVRSKQKKIMAQETSRAMNRVEMLKNLYQKMIEAKK